MCVVRSWGTIKAAQFLRIEEAGHKRLCLLHPPPPPPPSSPTIKEIE